MDLTAGAASIRGRGRPANEDALKIFLDQSLVRRAARGALFAVADGNGTEGHGRPLAWAAVEALGEFFDVPPDAFTVGSGLQHAFDCVGKAITEVAVRVPESATSTSTLTVMYVSPSTDKGVLITVGDSPVFVFHRDLIANLTQPGRDGPSKSRLGCGSLPQASHRTLKFHGSPRYRLI